jgi:hypothetical protein
MGASNDGNLTKALYMYIYMYVYVYVHVYVYSYVYIYKHVCMYVLYICIHVCMYVSYVYLSGKSDAAAHADVSVFFSHSFFSRRFVWKVRHSSAR